MTHNIHVYPIFRVKVVGLQGTPEEMVAAAEMAVGAALNSHECFGMVEVVGQGFIPIEFADGFDAALVDVVDGTQVLRSFTHSKIHETAKDHVETLDGLIDGERSVTVNRTSLLTEIRDFLRTIR